MRGGCDSSDHELLAAAVGQCVDGKRDGGDGGRLHHFGVAAQPAVQHRPEERHLVNAEPDERYRRHQRLPPRRLQNHPHASARFLPGACRERQLYRRRGPLRHLPASKCQCFLQLYHLRGIFEASVPHASKPLELGGRHVIRAKHCG